MMYCRRRSLYFLKYKAMCRNLLSAIGYNSVTSNGEANSPTGFIRQIVEELVGVEAVLAVDRRGMLVIIFEGLLTGGSEEREKCDCCQFEFESHF